MPSGNNSENDTLTRDLSLGGAVLLGLGAKQLLLPALSLSHPLLLAITVPTTLVTGRRYLRSLWDVGMLNVGKYLTQKRTRSSAEERSESQPTEPSSPPKWRHAFTHYAMVT